MIRWARPWTSRLGGPYLPAERGSRWFDLSGTTTKEPLLDILVHAQDIFVPLGREFVMPERPALVAADRIWQIPPPFGFGAKKRLHGLHIKATDAAWSRGEGPAVHGPLKAIVLLTSGRVTAALPYLSGDGMEILAARHGRAETAK